MERIGDVENGLNLNEWIEKLWRRAVVARATYSKTIFWKEKEND